MNDTVGQWYDWKVLAKDTFDLYRFCWFKQRTRADFQNNIRAKIRKCFIKDGFVMKIDLTWFRIGIVAFTIGLGIDRKEQMQSFLFRLFVDHGCQFLQNEER